VYVLNSITCIVTEVIFDTCMYQVKLLIVECIGFYDYKFINIDSTRIRLLWTSNTQTSGVISNMSYHVVAV